MATIRDLFHKLGNQHNKISVSAGVSRESLKRKPLDSLSAEELKEKNDKLVKYLNDIESVAVEAEKILINLKQAIYKLVSPDTEIQEGRQDV